MKKPLWVVQNNLGSTSDITKIRDAAEHCGAEFRGLRVVPFSDEMPDVENDRPVIFYGSARFTTAVAHNGRWTPGVFHDDDVLNTTAYRAMWGRRMLNSEAETLGFRDIVTLPINPSTEIFIRPEADDKSFAGFVDTFEKIRSWAIVVSRMDDAMISGETRVLLGPVHDVRAEWRCFIVDGKCITASQYQKDGRTHISATVPREVVHFAEESWAKWPLLPAVAIDVARMANDELRIVEAGSLHSTGFYAADISVIVAEVTKLAVRTWDMNNPKSKDK